MPDTGWLLPDDGVARDRDASPKGWNTPARIIASDNARSFSTPAWDGGTEATDWLFARDIGIALPTGSVVDGIVNRHERRVSIDGRVATLDLVKMRKADVEEGTGKSGANFSSNVDATEDLGGASDLWGGTWAAEDVNDVDFGPGWSYDYVSGAAGFNAQVDATWTKVHFTLPLGVEMGISAQTAVSAAGAGGAWNNVTNAQGTRDKNFSVQSLTDTSEFLECSNFDDFSAIPDGASIDGVRVRIRKRRDGADAKDSSIRLGTSTGTYVGDNKAATAVLWPAFSTQGDWTTYGGSTDDWSASLTAVQVKASTFLVAIQCIAADTSHGQVDAVEVTVWYTAQSPGSGSASVTVTTAAAGAQVFDGSGSSDVEFTTAAEAFDMFRPGTLPTFAHDLTGCCADTFAEES